MRGLYRIRGIGGLPNDVRVDDNGITGPLEESRYRAQGYLPTVEELLWQEDLPAEKAAGD
jgi:hypothetical protein